MKYWLLSFLLLSSWKEACGQSSAPRIKVGPNYMLPQANRLKLKGQDANLIPWEKVDPNKWMNFARWKKDLKYRENEPNWRQNIQEKYLRELGARVLECNGQCLVHRGLGFSRVKYKSEIRERDEISTGPDSNAWVYLLDGSLVRLWPNTSLTLKEINIGEEEIFVYFRINRGRVLWYGRQNGTYEINENKETDVVFLPLSELFANPPFEKNIVDEDNLFSSIADDKVSSKKYKRLNKLILENNKDIFRKKTFSFIVFPNGSISGNNIIADLFISNHSTSYVKIRSKENVGLTDITNSNKVNYYYRGYENLLTKELDFDTWYEIDQMGKSIIEKGDMKVFGLSEFITSNIPSILTAREILARKYTTFFHKVWSIEDLSKEEGYRLWGTLRLPQHDLYLRFVFLKEYTRRIETTNLLVRNKFLRKWEKEGTPIEQQNYNIEYDQKAMNAYFLYKDSQKLLNTNTDQLNSTKKPFWRRIHGLP